MTWNFNLKEMPVKTPVLVYLAEELTGSRIHTARKVGTAIGYMTTVATLFSYDAPQILAWHPMIDEPEQETGT